MEPTPNNSCSTLLTYDFNAKSQSTNTPLQPLQPLQPPQRHLHETTTTTTATATTTTTTTSDIPYNKKQQQHSSMVATSPHRSVSSLSPSNSSAVGSTSSRHSKQDVVQAVAAARRRQRSTAATHHHHHPQQQQQQQQHSQQQSPTTLHIVESLSIPSLHESRNDEERRRSSDSTPPSLISVVASCSNDGAECEVSIRPPEDDSATDCSTESTIEGDAPGEQDNEQENSNSSLTPPPSVTEGDFVSMSPETLKRKTEQIIMEAKIETMKWRSLSNYSVASSVEDPRRRAIIQEALNRAAERSKAASVTPSGPRTTATATTATTTTTTTQRRNPNDTAEESSSTDSKPMRTTAQVLELVSQTFPRSPPPIRTEDLNGEEEGEEVSPTLSPSAARAGPSVDGQPPLSPMTPIMTAVELDSSGNPVDEPSSSPGPSHCLSPTDSAGSIDDLEIAIDRLPTTRLMKDLPRDKVLRRVDGILASPVIATGPPSPMSSVATPTTVSLQFVEEEAEGEASIISEITSPSMARQQAGGGGTSPMFVHHPNKTVKKVKKVKTVVIKSMEQRQDPEEASTFSWFNFLWGGGTSTTQRSQDNNSAVEVDYESFAPMSCGQQRMTLHDELPQMATSLVKVASREAAEGYAEAIINAQGLYADPRMPEWIDNQFSVREGLPQDGSYQLAESRTVIVHELIRGNWTWCTAWSPDGKRLAIGTENHHLAVVDTYSSAVWRIRHDQRVNGLNRSGDATHSIRSIAWGIHFIAIGGVGNSVSILAPTEPYPILHTIPQTGFVGSLHWLKGTNTLLIGSRNGKAMIVKIWAQEKQPAPHAIHLHKDIQSTIVHTIDKQRAWINAAKFSPGGSALAIGDSKGILGVYSYDDKPGSPVTVTNIANFKLEDSILDIDWSPDGQWLYAGGEDFVVTVINTQWWEAVHRIKRDRWVQFISSSHGGSHVAIGGVSSEVSILEVDRGWDTAINVSLKGLVPLSAQWHPQDQYLVLTGQNNSVLAVETTKARYVTGHFLRSVSPILAIAFSPDGRMAAIGNEAGVVTIFKLSGTTFSTTYELVLDGDGSLSIHWSLNGAFLAVSAGKKVVIIARSSSLPGAAPPNASGFHVAQVIRGLGVVHDVAISPKSRYLALSGVNKTSILDASANFDCILEVETGGTTFANSWSPDGAWFATIGVNQNLMIYDTSATDPMKWKVIFTVQTKQAGLAVAWGPAMLGGLQYCAYGGEDKKVYIMEIRTKERTWETVLGIPRDGVIHDLDWNPEGLVAAAVGNGTVTVMDLSYLQSGWAVNEMDYNWQRQALTCFTEIRRNKDKNAMKCVRWIPSAPGSDSLLAVGGTDGEVEIVDLTDRQRCSGYNKVG